MQRNLILLSLLILLSCSPVKKYEKLPEVLSWENDIQQFEALDKSETYSKDAVIFAGSSSIRLWATLAQDMAPYEVIQRGYGGAKLSDFACYAGRIFSPHPCSAMVLFIANDITGSQSDKPPREVAELFRYVLKTFRRTHPDTPVFWIAITPTPSRWSVWNKIREANDLVQKVCEKNKNTYFINTDFAFLDASGNPRPELFREDKLHLNADGYVIWTDIIKKKLENTIPVHNR